MVHDPLDYVSKPVAGGDCNLQLEARCAVIGSRSNPAPNRTLTRCGHEGTSRFATTAHDASELGLDSAMPDSEAVVLDHRGAPDFDASVGGDGSGPAAGCEQARPEADLPVRELRGAARSAPGGRLTDRVSVTQLDAGRFRSAASIPERKALRGADSNSIRAAGHERAAGRG